jgi:ABC-type sugar transport system ATPase subunit
MAPFLELRRVSKRYVGVRALDRVDLALSAEEAHCLIVENGSPGPAGAVRIGAQMIYQDLAPLPKVTVAAKSAFSSDVCRPFSSIRRGEVAGSERGALKSD